jgi:hypothetical protein
MFRKLNQLQISDEEYHSVRSISTRQYKSLEQRRECIDTSIIDLGTSWRCGQLHTPAALPLLDKKLGGSQNRSGRRGEENKSCSYRGSNCDPSDLQDLASHNTDCAMAAVRKLMELNGTSREKGSRYSFQYFVFWFRVSNKGLDKYTVMGPNRVQYHELPWWLVPSSKLLLLLHQTESGLWYMTDPKYGDKYKPAPMRNKT